MMENRYEYLLERFRTKEITPEEQEELEALLRKDPALAKEYAWQQTVAGAWTALENRRIKTMLQEEEKAFQTPAPSRQMRFSFGRWAAAAAAVLAVAAAVWFLKPGGPPDAADFYTAYPDKISYGRGDAQSGLEMEAIGLYNAGKYGAAADAFRVLQTSYPDSILYAFYHGVALVGAGKYADAIPVLEPVALQSKYGIYQTNALWYLSLAQTGRRDHALARRTLIAYIERPDAVTYREKALKLLKKLPAR